MQPSFVRLLLGVSIALTLEIGGLWVYWYIISTASKTYYAKYHKETA